MLLIPEFSTYVAQGNKKAINFISNKIFKYTSCFSFCITSIFICFSSELGLAIYNNIEVGFYFKILAPLIFFMYMDNVIDSILKGLNKQVGVMLCNVLDLCITIGFICLLIPKYGIKGYIISIFISEILNFTVSLLQLVKYSKLKINFVEWIIIPFVCSFISYLAIKMIRFKFIDLIYNLICNIFLFIVLYFFIFIALNKFLKKTKEGN